LRFLLNESDGIVWCVIFFAQSAVFLKDEGACVRFPRREVLVF
jgi:hypothetical protein